MFAVEATLFAVLCMRARKTNTSSRFSPGSASLPCSQILQLAPPAPIRSGLLPEILSHHIAVSTPHSLSTHHLASSSEKQALEPLVKTVRIKNRILGVGGMAE